MDGSDVHSLAVSVVGPQQREFNPALTNHVCPVAKGTAIHSQREEVLTVDVEATGLINDENSGFLATASKSRRDHVNSKPFLHWL